MLTTLKGSALVVMGVLVLAIIGAVTYLAQAATLTGSDALTVYTLVLTGVVGVGSAHVSGQAAAQAALNAPLSTATATPAPTEPVPYVAPPAAAQAPPAGV